MSLGRSLHSNDINSGLVRQVLAQDETQWISTIGNTSDLCIQNPSINIGDNEIYFVCSCGKETIWAAAASDEMSITFNKGQNPTLSFKCECGREFKIGIRQQGLIPS